MKYVPISDCLNGNDVKMFLINCELVVREKELLLWVVERNIKQTK